MMTPTTLLSAALAALPDTVLAAAVRTSTAAGNRVPLLARPEEPPLRRIVWPLAIIIVLAGLLLGVLSIVRRRMRQADQPVPLRGFTLDDLRQLKREGKLTDEEFERAKSKIVAKVQASLKKDAKPVEAGEALNVEPKD